MSYLQTRACRRKAVWTETGSRTLYRVPILPDNDIVEHLGATRLRADGRWSWWRRGSKHHKWRAGQGVTNTKTEAIIKILEGWQENGDN